jgi:transcription termination factor Rho
MAQQGGTGRPSSDKRPRRAKKGSGKSRGSRRRGRRRGGPEGNTQDVPKYDPADLCPADGILDVMREGYGFLRCAEKNFLESPEDIFVPVSLIRKNSLLAGSRIIGKMAPPKRTGQKPALAEVETVDGAEPDAYSARVPFRDLTVIDPNEWFRLEREDNDDMTLRVIDLVSPIGKGQRTLIVAPPRTGKTIILQRVGQAIKRNFPEVHLMVLLINERPEEVTEFRRSIDGEVIASSLDELSDRHVKVATMVHARAQRMVEEGRNVVILLDSLTRLARAHNLEIEHSGRIMSGGVDSRALERPKAIFGAARKVEHGGSLTIIATALIDTGSRMDQVIFEEFKGTGNSEIVLSRDLADIRIYPAIDIALSGTRKEEKLIPPDDLEKVWMLRRVLSKMKPVEAMELLIDRLGQTKSNADFLERFRVKQ